MIFQLSAQDPRFGASAARERRRPGRGGRRDRGAARHLLLHRGRQQRRRLRPLSQGTRVGRRSGAGTGFNAALDNYY